MTILVSKWKLRTLNSHFGRSRGRPRAVVEGLVLALVYVMLGAYLLPKQSA